MDCFTNAAVANQAVNVNRFSTGFEKTVLTDLTSIEVRVPMAITLSSNTIGEPGAQLDVSQYELGNLAFVLKQVLYTNEQFWLTGGMGIQTPTANDIRITSFSGVDLLRVRNQSVRLQPYLATLYQTQNWFWQNFLQVDVWASGNDVLVNSQNKMQYLGHSTIRTSSIWTHRSAAGWYETASVNLASWPRVNCTTRDRYKATTSSPPATTCRNTKFPVRHSQCDLRSNILARPDQPHYRLRHAPHQRPQLRRQLRVMLSRNF